MFSIREFVKKGFLDGIGKQPDFWIRQNASGWYRDGILTAEDLAEIDAKIEAQYQVEESVEETPEEEIEENIENV